MSDKMFSQSTYSLRQKRRLNYKVLHTGQHFQVNTPPEQAVVPSDVIEIFNADTTVIDKKPMPEEEKGVELGTVDTETFYKPAEEEMRLTNRRLSKEEPEATAEEKQVKIEEKKRESSSKSSKSSSSSESRSSTDKIKSGKSNINKNQVEGKDRDEDRNRGKDRKSKSSERNDRDRRKSIANLKSSSSSSKERSENPSLQLRTAPMKRPPSPGDVNDPIEPPKKKLRMNNVDSSKRLSSEFSTVSSRESNLCKPAEEEMRLNIREHLTEAPEAEAGEKPVNVEKKRESSSKSSKSESRSSTDKEKSRKRNKNENKGEEKDINEDSNRGKDRKSKSSERNDRDRRKSVASFKSSSSSSKENSENPSLQLRAVPMKRTSPPGDVKDLIEPSQKKLRMDNVDIPDRRSSEFSAVILRESHLSLDAITAAATVHTPSVTKNASPTSLSSYLSRNQPQTSSTVTKEKKEEKPEIVSRNSKENTETYKRKGELYDSSPPATPTGETPGGAELGTKRTNIDGELKGILLHTKKKGPKRCISWKKEADLVDIRYFELDETERVDVPKSFGSMDKTDISNVRETLQHSRKLGGEDIRKPQIMWRTPFIINQDNPIVPGDKSLDKDIQLTRKKSIFAALYFDKRKIPASPEEPIPEIHQITDQIFIPLEDPESPVIDLRSTPWPEPKGTAPELVPVQSPLGDSIQWAAFHFNGMPPPSLQAMEPPRFAGPMGPNNSFPPNVMPDGDRMRPGLDHPDMGPSKNKVMEPNSNIFSQSQMSDTYGQRPYSPVFSNPSGPRNYNNHRPHRGGGGGCLHLNRFSQGAMDDGYGYGPNSPMFSNPSGPRDQNSHRPNRGGGGGCFRRGYGNNGGFRRSNGSSGGNMMRPGPNHPNMGPPDDMYEMHPNMFPYDAMDDGYGQRPDIPVFRNPTGPPNNFNNYHRPNRGGGFRRGNRNNGGNWVRTNSGRGIRRGGGGGQRGGRFCENVQNHGYCWNWDNCPFVHPWNSIYNDE